MSALDIRAAVFDADGTLFDTERLSRTSWREVGEEMGLPQPERDYLLYVGRSHDDILAQMRLRYGPDFPAGEFKARCGRRSVARMEREGVPVKEGAAEILRFLQARGVPLALATSTYRERTIQKLERTGLLPYFQAIVTGDQVRRSKPDPEIFLTACRALGVEPRHALAVEDSRNGILAAHAAGMPTAMVLDLVPPTAELEALLTVCRPSLLQLRDWMADVLPRRP